MVTPWYASREDVKSALDSAETARDNALVDAAIAAATNMIESPGITRRKFYPWTGTRYLPWPRAGYYARSYVLDLPATHEIISLSSLTAGGETIVSDDYRLEPQASGPPYTRIELWLPNGATFSGGDTHQRAITLTGVFSSAPLDERPAGTMAEALDATETQINLSTSADIGVGDLVKVDSERMVVTSRAMLTTGQTLQTPLTASVANVTVVVSDGTAYGVGETILLDAERMRVVDIAGNNLIVKRAHDGSALSAHAGSTIYAARALTVERGSVGTTAATHLDGATVYKHHPPALIHQLCTARAIWTRLNEGSGYGRVVGTGEGSRPVSLSTIRELESQVMAAYKPKLRKSAI